MYPVHLPVVVYGRIEVLGSFVDHNNVDIQVGQSPQGFTASRTLMRGSAAEARIPMAASRAFCNHSHSVRVEIATGAQVIEDHLHVVG